MTCARRVARSSVRAVLRSALSDALAQLVVLALQDVELVAHSASTETEVMWKPPGPIRRANSP